MVGLLVNWTLGATGLLAVSLLVPGFRIADYESALIVALAVGLLSSIPGMLLRVVTSVGALVLCAAFLVLADAILFRLAALVVPGFAMLGFAPAFVGAAILVLLQSATRFCPRVARLDSEQSLLHP